MILLNKHYHRSHQTPLTSQFEPANKLPDMKLVNVSDGGHWGYQTRFQSSRVNVCRDGVEEDEDWLSEEGPGADADEEDDDEGEERVQVVFILPVSQPDDRGADENNDTAQGVSHDVQEHSLDVELVPTGHCLLFVSTIPPSTPTSTAYNFSSGRLLAMAAVRMAASLLIMVAVSMAKYQHPYQVNQQSNTAHDQNHLWIFNLLDHQESLDCLNRDGEAESIEEDSIDESPHHLRPGPAEGVETAPPLTESVTATLSPRLPPHTNTASPHTDEGDDEGDDVTHHVETVRYQGHAEIPASNSGR